MTDQEQKPKKRRLTCSMLAVGILPGLLVGAYVGIFVPIGFTKPDKQQADPLAKEAPIYLAQILEKQEQYKEAHGHYGGTDDGEGCFKKIGWEPGRYRKHRYTYVCDRDIIPANHHPFGPCMASIRSRVEKDRFKVMAFANLDEDRECDVWSLDQTGSFEHIKADLATTEEEAKP